MKAQFTLSMLVLVCITYTESAYAACRSGPDYCTDDPRIPGALTEKKERLEKEYPGRLIALLDRGVQCIARIEQSPDAFTMVVVRPGPTVETVLWSQDNENAGKNEIQAGTIERFWIVNSRRAFQCDGEKPYNERDDYDATDDVNMSLALLCSKDSC